METVPSQHKVYWRKSLTITWIGLFLWLILTVLIGLYAREARELTLVYPLLTALYVWYQSRQDRAYG